MTLKSLKMKKRILLGLFALALLATAGYGVLKSMRSDAGLSNLHLSNVEALAQSETPEPITISCNYADLADDVFSGTFMWRCQGCSYAICRNRVSSSTCTHY